jgi:putative hydrolase of HD superfamily
VGFVTDADRLAAQLAFVLTADRLKSVQRRNRLADGSRTENSAEHSWHLALMALVLAEHAREPVDPARVVELVVVHDLVEIEVGDTFVYDTHARAAKAELEARAARVLFSQLPDDQATQFLDLWEEYESGASPEARFAHSLDRLSPLALNHAEGGTTWTEHGITAAQVRSVNRTIDDGSPELWRAARALIDDAVARGILSD